MLTIYRASAGAGKTHKLTGEYLTLLFTAPGAYRRILAVTFTNKATDEMKTRIVSELYQLASGNKSDYLSLLISCFQLNETQVRKKASQILIEILHDYSAFNISTIDRFFQQTMRAFTREIGLQGGYGIEMDQELVLTQAIDNLLNDLDSDENKELLSWLIRFATDKIENGGEWNLRREIMSLSREVFKETYKAFSDAVNQDISNKQNLEDYKELLFSIIRTTESQAKSIGEQALSLMDKHGLTPEDFKGGSRSPFKLFQTLSRGEMKAPSVTFSNLADNPDGWTTKTTTADKKSAVSQIYNAGLNDHVKAVNTLFENLTTYNTAKEIARHYYTLGILNDISQQIAQYRSEKNVMLIADTTELLHKVISGSDAPFIYEKTGTQVDHFMIDEFQDTSNMQWANFRPLIDESLAQDRDNLIVGDIKQSIYRFRNSDWKLLDEQVQQDFSPEIVKEETLIDNWRSCRSIVLFNNALFTSMPAVLQSFYNEALTTSSLSAELQQLYFTKIMSAYAKSCQHIPDKFQEKEGHVRIEFLEETEEADWKTEALDRIPFTLQQLQTNGYALKDIAILVRTNQEGALVAEKLLNYKEEHPEDTFRYDIISDDALFIGSSVAVRFLIAMLRYLKQPDDETNARLCVYAYQVLKGVFGTEPAVFPKEIQLALNQLSRLSLYEIAEGLFRLFADEFAPNEQVFIQAFMDMAAEYSQKETPDIGRFLKWWDESGYRKTIATPDAQDAIRILTVHKSKGLGFKAVIIPFCDWEIDHKPTKPVILWCHPEVAPFNRLHLVPVRYGQNLCNTIFAHDYFEERLHAFIDNLNTLYVAFTRAKEELIIFSPRPGKIKAETGTIEKISSLSDALWMGLCTDMGESTEGESLQNLQNSFDADQGLFELGNWWKPPVDNTKEAIKELPMHSLISIDPGSRLELRLYGRNFFFDDAQRKHGTLMHELLSRIRTSSDIERSVSFYIQNGIINQQEAEALIKRLLELLTLPDVASWYDGSAKVMNEVDILFGKGLSKRPDRVMFFDDEVIVVDYKFGSVMSKRYHQQVRQYIKLIREMGYVKIKGYLWYVELNKTELVGD